MSQPPVAPSFAPPPGGALAPFKHRLFATLWFASLASSFGGLIQGVGASWLMTSLSPSADMVALVQTSTSLPLLFFAMLGGAVADIYDRRIVMLFCQIGMLLVSLALAAVTHFDMITPWTLLVFTFLIGSGQAINAPSWQASVGEQVPREVLPAAVALNGVAFNIARSVGPAIGGLIVAAAGAPMAFVANAVSYLGVITVLLRWKRIKNAATLPPERIVPAVFAGIRYVRLSPSIRAVLFRALVFGFTASGIWALAPLVARDLLKGGPTTYGVLLGGIGVGAVGAAVVRDRIQARLSKEAVIRAFSALLGVSIILTAFSPWFALTVALQAAIGAAWLMTISTFNVTVQLTSPRWVVGRAVSLNQMSLFGGMAVGSWVWGHVAESFGVPAALVCSGAAVLASILFGFGFRVAQSEKIDLEPAVKGVLEFDVAVPANLAGAPVVVTVEYRVAREDAAAFLHAMREKRRIRRRDGARAWTLTQDLADPELWIERFHNPSWTEYVRQRHRTTIEDRKIEQQVRAFHKGDHPPAVRRMIQHRPEAPTLSESGGDHILGQSPLH